MHIYLCHIFGTNRSKPLNTQFYSYHYVLENGGMNPLVGRSSLYSQRYHWKPISLNLWLHGLILNMNQTDFSSYTRANSPSKVNGKLARFINHSSISPFHPKLRTFMHTPSQSIHSLHQYQLLICNNPYPPKRTRIQISNNNSINKTTSSPQNHTTTSHTSQSTTQPHNNEIRGHL